jgi:hypothetical protein
VIAVSAAAACGKKGPPLAPLVHIPAGVEQMSAQRVGSDVYVTLTIPSANIDEHAPADLEYVEVYGYTGRSAPPRARFAELGSLVATIPVAPPPAAAGESPPPPGARTGGAKQGTQVTVLDRLTPDDLVQGAVPEPTHGEDPTRGRRGEPTNSRPTAPVDTASGDPVGPRTGDPTNAPGAPAPRPRIVEPPPLRRFYMAYPWGPRRRVGPPSPLTEMPLLPIPDPPPSVAVEYSDEQVTLTWEPSGGLLGFLLERALPEEPLPFEIEPERPLDVEPERPLGIEPERPLETEPERQPEPPGGEPLLPPPPAQAGPIGYNVYRRGVDPFTPPQATDEQPWQAEPPVPLNGAPIGALTFLDTVRFGEEHCYTVRAVRGVGPDARVGDPSSPACVTAVDTFPPAPPTGLATVASAGAIHLIWEPNTEPDLGGYVVLRADAADDTLRPLTPTPITDASYHDAAVTPGARYVYAVVAVDNRFPVPNASEPSKTVEETAR